ncbi:flagellar export protein FliJ [uncultured Cellulomonas sp.]|uniref:flagellar export protein FliJ n=1 Tax=uncultured Cellulomonas sp. TaxID=189682 RepID=UPI002622243A|nr:flagellar FliJ family protein [uncultured Cellulomonas sp.]
MERAFRLAGLLRLRTLQEEQAAAALAAAHAGLQRADAARRATLAGLAGHAMPATGDAGAWRVATTGRAALTHLLADAAIAVDQAGERVTEHTADWSAARSRTVGLEKLHDQHRTAVLAEDARAEQHALDEVAARTARPAADPAPDVAAGPAVRPSTALRSRRPALPRRPQEPSA